MIFGTRKAMTLVELIIGITILAILSTIAFVSFSSYSAKARDAARTSDITTIKKALQLFETRELFYPEPTSGTEVTYLNGEVWTQGTFGSGTRKILRTVASEVVDPLTSVEYIYSILNTDREYELGAILEGAFLTSNDQSILTQTYAGNLTAYAYIVGDYNGYAAKVSTGGIDYVLAVPTIISGDMTLTDVIEQVNAGKLLYNGYTNLPLSYDSVFNVDGEDLIVTNRGETNIVVFSGSLNDLNVNEVLRTNFIKNLQNAYSGTSISGEDEISLITQTDIDTSNPTVESRQLAINIIEYGLEGEVPKSQKPEPAGCTLDGVDINHGEDIVAYSEETIVWNAVYDCSDRQLTRSCNEGILSGDISYQYDTCVKGTPNNCSATTQDGYNISAFNHGVNQPITKVISHPTESNGTRTFNATATCNNGIINITGESDSLVCDASYHDEADACVSDTRSCSETNGTGEQYWSGSNWSTCTAVSCNSGYHIDGTDCVSDNESCSITDGTGTRTWNGSSWDPCLVDTCGVDFYNPGNNTCSPVGNGYYSNSTNTTRTACTNYPDNSSRDYTYITDGNGTNSCSATYTDLCTVDFYETTNGTCSPVTTGYYSQDLTNSRTACSNKPANSSYSTDGGGSNNCGFTCDTNYTLNGGLCVDLTAPTGGGFTVNNNAASTASTSVTLNIICPTDAIDGSSVEVAYGNSTNPTNWSSCSSTKSHSLTTGDGTKTVYVRFRDTSNNTTINYTDTITLSTVVSGACSNLPTNGLYFNNASGYSLVNAPNGTTFDALTAGYNTSPTSNTCEWKCEVGYHREGNTCVFDTRVCIVSNGSGIETWNGSSWGACTVSACNTDFYNPGNNTCAPVGNGYYSNSTNTTRIACTNYPDNASRDYTYSSSGGGINNCSATYTDYCGVDTYETSNGVCSQVGNGYYSAINSNTRIACTNHPDTSSRDYTYTSDGNGTNSCSATYTELCGLDLYETSNGTCSIVGTGYYSPSNENSRTACTNNPDTVSRDYTYTSDGNGTNSCSATYTELCSIDLYETSNGTCSAVGTGYYSPNLENSRSSCTNKPSNSTYTTDGNGGNNCSWTCNANYSWNGSSCEAVTQSCSISDGTGEQVWNGSSWNTCTVLTCSTDFYNPGNNTCSAVGNGYYSDSSATTRTACTNYPDTVSRDYTYTSDGNGSNSCSATYTDKCGVDLYETSNGTCTPVGTGYYSTNNENSRVVCSNKPTNSSYISDGNGSNNCSFSCNSNYTWDGSTCVANTQSCSISNGSGIQTWNGSNWGTCLVSTCNIDYYNPGNNTCSPVGNGYYSNSTSTTRFACTTSPSDNDSRNYYYTSDGNGSNSCSYSYSAKCSTDYYELSNGVCAQVGTGHYSPSNNNSRLICTNSPVDNASRNYYYTSDGNGSNSCSYTYSDDCGIDKYESSNGTCSSVGNGYYSPNNNNSRISCTNSPSDNTSRDYYYTSDGGGTNSCSYTYSADCGTDYYETSNGTCSPVGTGYYSPNNNNSRYSCTNLPSDNNSRDYYYTGDGNGSNNCSYTYSDKCGTDYYEAGNGTCSFVGAAFYSPNNNNNRYSCSNKPSAAGTYYTSAGSGSNSCSWTCTSGYTRNSSYGACVTPAIVNGSGLNCSDSSTGASWYKSYQKRCGATAGINYWNNDIAVYGETVAYNSFVTASGETCSGYGGTTSQKQACNDSVVCSGSDTYISNTIYCKKN